MDDIEHELVNFAGTIGEIAKALRVREVEISVRDAGLARDLSELIPLLDKTQHELGTIAGRWHSTY